MPEPTAARWQQDSASTAPASPPLVSSGGSSAEALDRRIVELRSRAVQAMKSMALAREKRAKDATAAMRPRPTARRTQGVPMPTPAPRRRHRREWVGRHRRRERPRQDPSQPTSSSDEPGAHDPDILLAADGWWEEITLVDESKYAGEQPRAFEPPAVHASDAISISEERQGSAESSFEDDDEEEEEEGNSDIEESSENGDDADLSRAAVFHDNRSVGEAASPSPLPSPLRWAPAASPGACSPERVRRHLLNKHMERPRESEDSQARQHARKQLADVVRRCFSAVPSPAKAARAPSARSRPCSAAATASWTRVETGMLRSEVSPCAMGQEKRRRIDSDDSPESTGLVRFPEEARDRAQAATEAPVTNIRILARKCEKQLETRVPCRFNALQKDDGIVLEADGLRAACRDELAKPSQLRARDIGSAPSPTCAGYGVKALPMICGGRYQYEVELLRKSALVVGWSVATALPSGCGGEEVLGYGSTGNATASTAMEQCVRSSGSVDAYGPPFGETGDVVGAFVEWGPRGFRVSFALNGYFLGPAYSSNDSEHPPLQLHICQAPGPPFSVLLRGASPAAPLRFPVDRFCPLMDVSEAHFCPFSTPVARATARARATRTECPVVPTVARRLIHGILGVQPPLSHVVQERCAAELRRKHRQVAGAARAREKSLDADGAEGDQRRRLCMNEAVGGRSQIRRAGLMGGA